MRSLSLLALGFGCSSGDTPAGSTSSTPDAAVTEGADARRTDAHKPSGEDAPSSADDAAHATGDAASAIADAAAADPDGAAADVAGDRSGSALEAGAGIFTLASDAFPKGEGGGLVFPPWAVYPANESPPFAWTGAPAGTKSFALVFRDVGINAIKWILWDIPADTTMLPRKVSANKNPSELPGTTQRGSLGRTAYSGPELKNETYDFTLWALDVPKLAVPDNMMTKEIFSDLLPKHKVATTPPIVARTTTGR